MRKALGSAGQDTTSPVAREVGASLRRARLLLGLSLQDVEEKSGHEFKASVLGAYERGDRAISVARLHRLALAYDVSIETLLPRVARPGPAPTGAADAELPADLDERLATMSGDERDRVMRFVQMIRSQRQGGDGSTSGAIRADDVRAIELLLGPSTGASGTKGG
jgi:transcriptional regulator with XRE-family HTH domain